MLVARRGRRDSEDDDVSEHDDDASVGADDDDDDDGSLAPSVAPSADQSACLADALCSDGEGGRIPDDQALGHVREIDSKDELIERLTEGGAIEKLALLQATSDADREDQKDIFVGRVRALKANTEMLGEQYLDGFAYGMGTPTTNFQSLLSTFHNKRWTAHF